MGSPRWASARDRRPASPLGNGGIRRMRGAASAQMVGAGALP
jgi:hypothetical protein